MEPQVFRSGTPPVKRCVIQPRSVRIAPVSSITPDGSHACPGSDDADDGIGGTEDGLLTRVRASAHGWNGGKAR